MEKKYYCPTCKEEVEVIEACGASSYFCNKCKKLISSKAALEEKDLEGKE
ncbi:YfgJ family double zinc ribbon protein [Cellulosilyticum sp. I15G10I2]|nr:zinc-ribbon domain-containing protein [Cellulosilyticum sp. I15G10I2]